MAMRDYEEMKNVQIPKEQEEMMDIICDAWEECRCGDCKNCNYHYYYESENGTEEECMSPIECFKPIARPPQSWAYCEEVSE